MRPATLPRLCNSMNPKILSLDIETFPALAAVWTLWDASALEVKQPSIICCYSAKWLGGKQVTEALPDFRGYKPGKEDDSKLVQQLWDLLDQADAVVAHHGKRFDLPRINARFAKHLLQPPSPYKIIDTREIAAKVFGFGSNKLDYLCQYLGLGNKMQTGGYELWQDCMAGDMKAWKKMKAYNHHDVVLLEKLYLRLLPWIPDHPNYNIYNLQNGCTRCGSQKLQSRGMAHNNTRSYRRFQCTVCGGWNRSTTMEKKTTITNA